MEEKGMASMNLEEILNNLYSDELVEVGEKSFEEPQMTLEAFLTKAGTVTPNDLPVTSQQLQPLETNTSTLTTITTTSRLKRPAPEDKMSQQRQRRMIKNRESAARSRQRKQAYTVELEALVMQLEEENARLVREEAERSRKRFNKLMETLVPVEEKQGPMVRAHRRGQSVGW